MRRYVTLTITVYALLFISIVEASANQTIIGEVTLVGDRVIKIKEDRTQMEYELQASPDKLASVMTGYRVEVNITDGKVSSLKILGMPMKAEPEPFQKWTVIKQPKEAQEKKNSK